MQGKAVKLFLVFQIYLFSQILQVKSMTCNELESKIKSYKDEIASLKISLEEYELFIGKREDVSDECNEALTCSNCLKEKRKPQCGWCVLRNRCSLSQNCPANNSSSDFWIFGSKRCPKVKAVKPYNISAFRPEKLQVVIPHLPDYDGIFICSFEVLGQILVTKGKKFDRGITCTSPHPRKLPRIPIGSDHVIVTLSVRTFNGPKFASISNFTIYNCNHLQTCIECSTSVFPCSWCIDGHKCTHDIDENCRNDVIVSGKSITRLTIRQGPDYCPRISYYIDGEDKIIVPSGSKKRIRVKVENIMGFHMRARYTCKVKGLPEVTGNLLGDIIFCDEISFVYSDQQPVYNLSFSVYINGRQLDNPQDIHVEVFNCGRMAESCGECLDLPAKYNCGWCEEDNSCVIRESCAGLDWLDNRHTCNRPEITSIYPEVGMLTENINLTMEGVNLAKEFEDISNIKFMNEENEVVSDCVAYENLHVRHSRIVCFMDTSNILYENNETFMGFINVRLSNPLSSIEVPYSFANPIVIGFEPVNGMASGGTLLKISGYHLNAGNNVEVYIGDLPCHIVSRDPSSIRCISSPLSTDEQPPKSSAVRVIFDGQERVASDYFFYVADPSVFYVKGEHGSESPVGTTSGGNSIIVEGRNFDYAPSPYIYVIVDDVEYPGLCAVISEKRMECLSPRIPSETLNFCDEEGFLSFHYGFRMGDVKKVQNISRNSDFTMYSLYPDPYLMPFNKERKIKTWKSDYLTIEGKYLDTVFNENDFTVTVGGEECPITSLTHTQLTCRIPEMQRENYEENRLLEVQVKIRSSFEYFIGFFRHEKV